MKIKPMHAYYFIIIAVLILAAYLLLNNFSKKDKGAPIVDDKNKQEKIIEEENVPKAGMVSGEVVNISKEYFELKVNIYGNKEQIVKIKSPQKVVKISGNYDKDGKLNNAKEEEIDGMEIKKGDYVSVVFKELVKIEEIGKEILKSNHIIINPPGNPELN